MYRLKHTERATNFISKGKVEVGLLLYINPITSSN